MIHRGERRYGCSTCEKRFHRSDALKNHERIHTGAKPYACGVCSKSFRQKGDRDKHFRSRHSNFVAINKSASEMKINTEHNLVKHLTQMRPIFKNVNGIDILTMTNS